MRNLHLIEFKFRRSSFHTCKVPNSEKILHKRISKGAAVATNTCERKHDEKRRSKNLVVHKRDTSILYAPLKRSFHCPKGKKKQKKEKERKKKERVEGDVRKLGCA